MISKVLSGALCPPLSLSALASTLPCEAAARGNSTLRITGVLHDIDFDNGVVAVGFSDFGSGVFVITRDTKFVVDGQNATFFDIANGDTAEVSYVYSAGKLVATKLQVTSAP